MPTKPLRRPPHCDTGRLGQQLPVRGQSSPLSSSAFSTFRAGTFVCVVSQELGAVYSLTQKLIPPCHSSDAGARGPLLWGGMPPTSGSSGKSSCSSSSGSKWRNSSKFNYLLHPLKRRIRVCEKDRSRGFREVYSTWGLLVN